GIILDLHMADGAKQHLFNGTKLLAMSFANDDEAAALAYKIGAAKLLDKLELSNELILAILELAPERAVLSFTSFLYQLAQTKGTVAVYRLYRVPTTVVNIGFLFRSQSR